jgi:molecular chaperone GrpE
MCSQRIKSKWHFLAQYLQAVTPKNIKLKMDKNEEKYNETEHIEESNQATEETASSEAQDAPMTDEQQIALLQEQLEREKKEYLFLMAEFDNFRKRVVKEKADIIKNAKGQALEEILPIIDDFERGLKAASETDNAEAVKEGMNLIYSKCVKFLEKNGVTAMVTNGEEFNEDLHEAITAIPAPDESMRKKIIDTVQTGYMINDKVLRHAKVVVGQ